jgi:hypothetical protein
VSVSALPEDFLNRSLGRIQKVFTLVAEARP